jgi:CelD/BcsL family acetyltransferase involved in cellulose biosynthesis
MQPPPPSSSVGTLTLEDSRWLSFITSQGAASPFHHPSWGRLIARTYGFRPFVLAVIEAGGEIGAGIPVMDVKVPFRPRRWISLPFVDYCPPLGSHAGDGLPAAALDDVRRASGITSFEIRAPVEAIEVRPPHESVRHTLELTPDLDAQFAQLHSTCKRNVRVAQRNGLQAHDDATDRSLLDDFYSLHVETRRRLGVPVQPRRFFRNLWEDIIEPGLGYIVVVRARDRPLAAAVFLAWNGTVIYKYGASDHRAWKERPNNLLFWHAISKAAANAWHTFDFGRTELAQSGLRAFKMSWGANEWPLAYSYLGEGRPVDRTVGSAAISAVVRHTPLWTTRLLGELFYRYAA